MSLDLQYEPEVVVDITGLSNEDWLEYRKSGIGGSDAGIILGVSSYKLPRDVYFEKIGRTPDMPEDENWVTLEVGKRLEDLVAEIFAKKTGFRVWKEKRMLRHPLYPYMIADIDYMYETSSGEIGILECKTGSHYVKDKWDGGAVPYTYEVQCRHYMAVRNVFASYAACLHGNTENDFIYQKIERDLDFEEDLVEQEGMFWYDYVEKQKEPPLTGDGDLMLRSLKCYQAERNQQEEWTIVNKVDTIYKEKCRVQLLSAVPSTILLFHLVSSFRENYAVFWHYRILRCIRIQITGVPAENDMFYG